MYSKRVRNSHTVRKCVEDLECRKYRNPATQNMMRIVLVCSSPPGVGAGVEGAVGVCGHGGVWREHGRGSGGGPGHTQPAGQCQPETVPQQSQPG